MTPTNEYAARNMAQSPCKANINQQGTLEVAAGTSVLSRIPEFWKDQPRLWFTQLEAILAPQKQGDEYKYCTVIAKLSKEEILQVSDLITSPPTTDKYKNIKERLIDCYEETEQRQFQKLISETELGDQKPSQLLRQMRVLGRGKISDETIKLLWFRLLPTSVTTVLAVTEDMEIDKLSQIADKIIMNSKVTEISAVSNDTSSDNNTACILTQLAKLQIDIDAIQQGQYGYRPNTHNHFKKRQQFPVMRPRTNYRGANRFCYYHERFGKYARNCIKPCGWKPMTYVRNQGNE